MAQLVLQRQIVDIVFPLQLRDFRLKHGQAARLAYPYSALRPGNSLFQFTKRSCQYLTRHLSCLISPVYSPSSFYPIPFFIPYNGPTARNVKVLYTTGVLSKRFYRASPRDIVRYIAWTILSRFRVSSSVQGRSMPMVAWQ